MSTTIVRKFSSKGPFNLSDEAMQRGREHLKSVGIDFDRLPKIIWPDDAVYAYQKHIYAPWEYTTKADVRRKRQEDAKLKLRYKRGEYRALKRLPAYVWVFYCPGISGIFEGWWTYIIGRGFQHGGKRKQNSDLILKAMELFPLTLHQAEDDWEAREDWMMAFAKRYQRGKWCGKPQGKAPIWCEVQGNCIEKILERTEWPGKKGIDYVSDLRT